MLKFESSKVGSPKATYSLSRSIGIVDIIEINEIIDKFEKLDALDNLERTAFAKKRSTPAEPDTARFLEAQTLAL